MDQQSQQALDSAGPAPQVRALLEQLSDEHGLHHCAKGGGRAEGLGAAPDAYAAVYCSPAGLSIALAPADAKVLADKAGFSVTAKTSATHYVKVPAGSLNQPATAELVAQALRTAHNRSWEGPAGTAARLPPGHPASSLPHPPSRTRQERHLRPISEEPSGSMNHQRDPPAYPMLCGNHTTRHLGDDMGKTPATPRLEAQAALTVEEALQMAEQAIGNARAGVSRAQMTRRSAARIDARIREVAGWADLIRFHVTVTEGVNGGVMVVSAIDYGRISQPSIFGFVPIGPKHIGGMSTYQKFLDLFSDSLNAADAAAQIRRAEQR